MFVRIVIAAAAAVLLALAPAAAATVKLTDAAPNHDKTWADLVRILLPDLTLDGFIGRAEVAIPLRHIMEGEGGRPPATIELSELKAMPFRGHGPTGTLIYFELGQSDDRMEITAYLAYFDDRLRLVDAVDVGMGPRNGIDAPFAISPTGDAISIYATFGNSAYSSTLYAPIFLDNGRFTLVDRWPVTQANDCGWQQFQDIKIEAKPEDSTFWPVTVTLEDTLETDPTVSCPNLQPQPGIEAAAVTYRWNESRRVYVPETDALQAFISSRPDLY